MALLFLHARRLDAKCGYKYEIQCRGLTTTTAVTVTGDEDDAGAEYDARVVFYWGPGREETDVSRTRINGTRRISRSFTYERAITQVAGFRLTFGENTPSCSRLVFEDYHVFYNGESSCFVYDDESATRYPTDVRAKGIFIYITVIPLQGLRGSPVRSVLRYDFPIGSLIVCLCHLDDAARFDSRTE